MLVRYHPLQRSSNSMPIHRQDEVGVSSVIFFTPLFVDTTLGLPSYTAIRHIRLGFAKWYKSIGAVAGERLVKEYRDPLGQRFAGYVKFFTSELLNL
ncbi:unnamed protein product [Prunus brigantina]